MGPGAMEPQTSGLGSFSLEWEMEGCTTPNTWWILQAFAASRVTFLSSVQYGDLRSTDLPHFFVHFFPACLDDYVYVEAAPRSMPYPGGG